jgi:pyruvate,water dikinase
VALSIGVQQMVRSDKAGSGVMFTIDTETGFPNVVVVSAAWGLGETLVQGSVDPDKYVVFKPLLERKDSCPIIEKSLGKKAIKLGEASALGRQPRRQTAQSMSATPPPSVLVAEIPPTAAGAWRPAPSPLL